MIVAFDPGVSTGIAILDDDGEVSQTLVTRSPSETDAFCISFKKEYGTSEVNVVAESGPQFSSNYRKHIEEVEQVIKNNFLEVTWVPPSRWKGTPQAKKAELPPGLTQHEKDAARLGFWFKESHAS